MSTAWIRSVDATSRRVLESVFAWHGNNRNLLGAALLTAAAYYLGAKVGLALTFPPLPVSVLWPPNAILLAALLMVPTRWWWAILAAVFPVHLVAELQGGVPLMMVLSWFVSNCTEALIGAGIVRAMTKHPHPFETLTGVTVFVLSAALLAPFLSSFLDAAFVRLNGWGQSSYWEVWRARFLANALATLTLVPLVLTWCRRPSGSVRPVSPDAIGEAAALACGLLVAGLLVFEYHDASTVLMPAILYLPLPFMLWAAFRFGPRGASAVCTVVGFLAIVGAAHGRGPFAAGSSADNALAVQLFLIFVCVFLLCLAAVMAERNEAERALRESEDRYRAVVDSHTDLLCRYLPDTTITFVNAAYCRFFGRSAAELIGRKFIDFVPEGAREAVLVNIERAIRSQGPVTLEHEVIMSDGNLRWQQWIDEPVRAEGVATGEMQGIGRDITERKRMEDHRRELSHATRLVMVGELTAGIAHEINQPLGAILCNVDAAEMLLDSQSDCIDEVRKILDDIRRDDIRASEVIRHMRSLLRKREMEMRPLDLNALIDEVLRLVASDAARRQTIIETRLNPVGHVNGDRVHLQQVLLNLVLNGLEAMVDTPRSRRRLIVFSGRTESGDIEVCVSDAGHGIPAERMRTIFESFVSTKPDGMGLGLSIARSIIEAHGGRIEARNNAMAGAMFRFELPAYPSAGTADATAASASARGGA